MAGFDWFWKAMGGKQGRNQKRSLAIVDEAHTKKQQLTQLTDAQLVTKARDLTSTGEITDAAEFLAILAIAAERTLKMTPFPVQSQAVLRLLEGDVIQMATGEGKTLVGARASTHNIWVCDIVVNQSLEYSTRYS